MGVIDQNEEPEAQQEESFIENWEPEAWVYFIWLVVGDRVYFKVGKSVDPFSRLDQLLAGMPEEPYRTHHLPCLTEEQAVLFERMFHQQLAPYRTRGEWYSHANVKHLYGALYEKLEEILTLFYTFGYQPYFETIHLKGNYPVLHQNGFLDYVRERAGSDKE